MFRFLRTLVTENTRIAVLLLLTVMVVLSVYLFRDVLLPFALAIFLAYLLAPVIDRLSRVKLAGRHMPRGLSILLVYALMLGLIIVSGIYLFPRFYVEVNRMVKTLPHVLRDVEVRYVIPVENHVNAWVSTISSTTEPDGASPRGEGTGAGAVSAALAQPGEDHTSTPHEGGQAAPHPEASASTAHHPGGGHPTAGVPGASTSGSARGLPSGHNTPGPATPSLPGNPSVAGGTPGNKPRLSGEQSLSPWRALLEDYTYVVHRKDDTHFEIIPQRRRFKQSLDDRTPYTFDRQVSQIYHQFRVGFEENFIGLMQVGRRFVTALVSSFFTLFLVLMISGFLLLDPARIHGFMASLIPQANRDAYADWMRGLDHGLSGVVRGQVMICLINGVLTGIGIGVLGVPFAVTLSVIAAVFSLIPIFGVLLSSVPILLMGLSVSLYTALMALAWILVIHFIEGNFLNPKILGDAAKIHPVLIVFALVVGEHVGGVLGALLAVPVFSLIQNSFLFLKHKAEDLEIAK